jgi:hypothetical protein
MSVKQHLVALPLGDTEEVRIGFLVAAFKDFHQARHGFIVVPLHGRGLGIGVKAVWVVGVSVQAASRCRLCAIKETQVAPVLCQPEMGRGHLGIGSDGLFVVEQPHAEHVAAPELRP